MDLLQPWENTFNIISCDQWPYSAEFTEFSRPICGDQIKNERKWHSSERNILVFKTDICSKLPR